MSEHFNCPFCDVSKNSKRKMDFHIKYGHAAVYPLLKEEITKVDLEAKLNLLLKEREDLEKDINHIKAIIRMKPK